ncbi:phosphatidylinositol transfer protein alphaisoform-like [Lichtheimia corymbifera JMRC:FSU:9682]|uniref:Phosphatidylinositol transfer protein alphaisoform-like n=1 Tax=Lichtheimia corymbifera JMRC:FSU:9682 TaxID=1263082 RepID=A0A068RTN7_9FUNG|nr:phosphatidylinositol transfer protein alphaisoform-like [Lichtheimia corymbifera JMRC:FSU:9682]
MLIKEFRVINNCTEAEYKIGQLYATAMASKEQTGGGEGVEVIKNEPYEKENGEKGQYTYKIFRLASRVPGFVRALAPAGALDLYEEDVFFVLGMERLSLLQNSFEGLTSQRKNTPTR